jgi:hypothetical protein
MKRYILLCIAVISIVVFPATASAGVTNFDSIELDGYLSKLALKIASIAMAGADHTLTALEYICNLLIVTGSPSGNSLIAPTPTDSSVGVLYTVRNAGSDSQAVVIQTSGGASVSIATGKTATVFCKSTGCYRITDDATH